MKISSAVEIDGDFLTVEAEAATYEEARDKLDALVPEGGKLVGIIVDGDRTSATACGAQYQPVSL